MEAELPLIPGRVGLLALWAQEADSMFLSCCVRTRRRCFFHSMRLKFHSLIRIQPTAVED